MAATQSVQVVDGGQALIRVGQSLPMPLRQVVRGPGGVTVTDSVVYRDIGQGPGNQGYGSVNSQRVSTTISGRLGEWIELGGSGQQMAGNVQGNLSSATQELRDYRSVWLRVEELP